ncbi:MalY/PatB family protein [Clostridium beijerinckii]|uniref:MalY/PatB family protein n=1 Tax=Clostridium beijerinckii TaxID=1520 RepID=UPI0030FEB38B
MCQHYTIVRALTKEEDNVLVMTPVYYPFYKAITDNNRKIIKSELILNEDHYEINFEDFEEKAKLEDTKLLILCNPHNPVGRVWSEDELKNIGRICSENNVIVVSDEIHFDLIMPGFKHTVFANISEEFANNSVICTAPSKTFNLAGLQVSNIIIKNKKIRDKVRFERRKSIGNLGLNIFGYKACEIAYNECEQWLEELIQTINKNRKVVEDFFMSNIPEVNIINLEGTYLQWLDFRTLEKDHKALEKFMTTEAMFFLDEGYVFGDEGKGFERINLACPTKVLEEALDRLLEAVERCYRYTC